MFFVTDKRPVLFKGTFISYIKEEWWGTGMFEQIKITDKRS